MAKEPAKTTEDLIVQELDAIKRLLILQLLKMGTPHGEIARALGIGQSTLTRMMPARKFPPFRGT